MSTSIDILKVRAVLGRDAWLAPESWGPDGWYLVSPDGTMSVVISCFQNDDGVEWIHASIAHREEDPAYGDLKLLHRAVWGDDGYAYQVFASSEAHVNIHDHALHLWGRLDGKNVLPDFGASGTI